MQPAVGAPRSWREGVGARCWVRAAPGRRTREGGLSPRQLAAALELLHFQGAEVALLGGLEAWVYQPRIHTCLTLTRPLGPPHEAPGDGKQLGPLLLSVLTARGSGSFGGLMGSLYFSRRQGVSRLRARSLLCPGHLLSPLAPETQTLDPCYLVGILGAHPGDSFFQQRLSCCGCRLGSGRECFRPPRKRGHQHQEMPGIAWCSWHGSEVALPLFSRICPSGLDGGLGGLW